MDLYAYYICTAALERKTISRKDQSPITAFDFFHCECFRCTSFGKEPQLVSVFRKSRCTIGNYLRTNLIFLEDDRPERRTSFVPRFETRNNITDVISRRDCTRLRLVRPLRWPRITGGTPVEWNGSIQGAFGAGGTARDFWVSKSTVFLHSIPIGVHRCCIMGRFNELNVPRLADPPNKCFTST